MKTTHISHYVNQVLAEMVMDMSTVDTTTGSGGAMAPPEGEELSPASYRELMRDRYRNNPMYRQHMRVFARRLANTTITGLHAADARWILEKI